MFYFTYLLKQEFFGFSRTEPDSLTRDFNNFKNTYFVFNIIENLCIKFDGRINSSFKAKIQYYLTNIVFLHKFVIMEYYNPKLLKFMNINLQ